MQSTLLWVPVQISDTKKRSRKNWRNKMLATYLVVLPILWFVALWGFSQLCLTLTTQSHSSSTQSNMYTLAFTDKALKHTKELWDICLLTNEDIYTCDNDSHRNARQQDVISLRRKLEDKYEWSMKYWICMFFIRMKTFGHSALWSTMALTLTGSM